jgi:malonate-semialdehyde dehydrogenase (acetylating) / methylmalonate-semialdehyde dehydrogenase
MTSLALFKGPVHGAFGRCQTAAHAIPGQIKALSTTAHLWINGNAVSSSSDKWIEVKNPATQAVVNRVPEVTQHEFTTAVQAAKEAWPAWADTPVVQRQRVMVRLAELVRRHTDELAESITTEQGKTLKDAQGDVFRGLEVQCNRT